MYKDLLSIPLISDQIELAELSIILQYLDRLLDSDLAGDVVEFGCYSGTTSLFLRRLINAHKSDAELYVYDSFDGLPEKSAKDESPLGADFKRGELRSTKNKLIENFRKANVKLPIITKKWFHEITPEDLPASICFAFLDGDYYKSIRSSMELIKPRLVKGAMVIIDDYDNPKLPGVKKACDDMGLEIKQVISSLAIVEY